MVDDPGGCCADIVFVALHVAVGVVVVLRGVFPEGGGFDSHFWAFAWGYILICVWVWAVGLSVIGAIIWAERSTTAFVSAGEFLFYFFADVVWATHGSASMRSFLVSSRPCRTLAPEALACPPPPSFWQTSLTSTGGCPSQSVGLERREILVKTPSASNCSLRMATTRMASMDWGMSTKPPESPGAALVALKSSWVSIMMAAFLSLMISSDSRARAMSLSLGVRSRW